LGSRGLYVVWNQGHAEGVEMSRREVGSDSEGTWLLSSFAKRRGWAVSEFPQGDGAGGTCESSPPVHWRENSKTVEPRAGSTIEMARVRVFSRPSGTEFCSWTETRRWKRRAIISRPSRTRCPAIYSIFSDPERRPFRSTPLPIITSTATPTRLPAHHP